MRSIIEGKIYDTNTAKHHYDFDIRFANYSLYCSPKGQWWREPSRERSGSKTYLVEEAQVVLWLHAAGIPLPKELEDKLEDLLG